MPLKLILGPPNSGRAGVVRAPLPGGARARPGARRARPSTTSSPSSASSAARAPRWAARCSPSAPSSARSPPPPAARPAPSSPPPSAAAASRSRSRSWLPRLGPLRRSAGRPGFAAAFARLLDELQAAGVEPARRRGERRRPWRAPPTSPTSPPSSPATRRRASAAAGSTPPGSPARRSPSLRADPGPWAGRPVFLYGLDDLTPAQFDLVEALAAPHRGDGRGPLRAGQRGAGGARRELLEQLRAALGPVAEEESLAADPGQHRERPALRARPRLRPPRRAAEPLPEPSDLTLLRSAGTRAEAEAIAAEVSRLSTRGAAPDEIAVALRDPGRRGPEVEAALEANGIAAALEAEVPVAGDLGRRRRRRPARDRLRDRPRRRPPPLPARPLGLLPRPGRLAGAGDPPRDRIAETAADARWRAAGARDDARADAEPARPRSPARGRRRSPAALCAAVGAARRDDGLAAVPHRRGRAAPRPRRRRSSCAPPGRSPRRSADLAALGPLAPAPGAPRRDRRRRSTSASGAARSRAGCGSPAPTACAPPASTTSSSARCRTASSRAATAAATPSSPRPSASARPRPAPRHRSRGALPLRRLPGAAAPPPLPLLPRQRRERRRRVALAAARGGRARCSRRRRTPADGDADPVEAAITRVRGLADVVAPLAEAPSDDELARALAAHGPSADAAALLAAVGIRRSSRPWQLAAAQRLARATASAAPAAPRPPRARPARSPTRRCSPRSPRSRPTAAPPWRVRRMLLPLVRQPRAGPQPLDPVPDPLVQGGLIHAVLERLYRERPGGDPLPRPASLPLWIERGRDAPRRAARRARSSAATRPSGRWRGGSSACSSASSAKRPRATPAASSRGCWRRASGSARKPSGRPSTSAAGASTGRSTGSTGRPTAAPSSTTTSSRGERHPARQVRGAGEAAAAALPARRADPLGRRAGRRHLPPAARDLEPAPARRRREGLGGRPRRLRPLRGPTWSTTRRWRSCWRTTRRARRRDRRPDPRRGDPPRPRPARGPPRPRRLPDLVLVRADLPPRPRALLCGAGRERSRVGTVSERRRAARPASAADRSPEPAVERTPTPEQARRDRGPRPRRPARGRRRLRQDRGDGRALRPPRRRRGRLPRRVLAFTFTDKAAAELRARVRAELSRRAAGTGAAAVRAAALLATIGGAWITTIHGFCNRVLAAHPVAAGVDPGFRVLDQPEAQRAAREAFDTALAEFLAGGDPAREETVAAYDLEGLRGVDRRRPRRAAQPRRRRPGAPRPARLRPGRGDRRARSRRRANASRS